MKGWQVTASPFEFLPGYCRLFSMDLPTLSYQNKNISFLELDQTPHLASWLGLELKQPENIQLLKTLLLKLSKVLSPDLSGLVLDPIYSFEAATKELGKTEVLFRLSSLSEAVDPMSVPQLIPNWGPEEIANNFATAKLELHYHPEEEKALAKKQLVAEIYDYCQFLDIPLLLKLIIYTPAGREFDQVQFEADQLQAVWEFRAMTDILALQYPFGPLAAATITAELDSPWLLMSQGQDYDEYKLNLREVLENGAAGFLAGDSLYQDLQKFKLKDKSPDWEQIDEFVRGTLRDRVIELGRIVEEKTIGPNE